MSAIIASLIFLSFLFISIIGNGYTALFQTFIQVYIHFDPDRLPQDALSTADYPGIVKSTLRNMFPEVKGRGDKRQLYKLASSGAAFQLREMVMQDRSLIGKRQWIWVPADDDVDMLIKGHLPRQTETGDGRLSSKQLAWIDQLTAENRIRKQFNITFFTAGDSREPELAGIWGAVCGSFFTLLITLMLSFPIGVAAAIYLEEFAP